MQNTSGILVLGMHRSGTSAVARVLNLGGADLGTRVLAASSGNEAGHWEDAFAVETHERLLAGFGTRWSEPFALPSDVSGSEPSRTAYARILDYLRTDRSRHRLWAVKDPRLCLFAGLWEAAAAEAGLPVGAVLVLRHPLEVARSLEVRDGIGSGHALLLWLESMLEAVAVAERMAHAVIRYDALLDNWRNVVDTIVMNAGATGLSYPTSSAAEVDAFLDCGLRHHRAPGDDLVPSAVREIWDRLLNAGKEGRLRQGTAAWMRARVQPLRELLHPYADEERASQRVLWERVGRAEARALDAATDTTALTEELAELRERADRHRNDLVELLSTDIRRMQDMVTEATRQAGLAEGKATMADMLPSLALDAVAPHLDAVASRLERAVLEARAQGDRGFALLGERIDRVAESLIEAYSEDIRRMQRIAADSLGEAEASRREASIAEDVAPKLEQLRLVATSEAHELRERIDRHGDSLVQLFSTDIRRMQQVAAEALADAASARQALEAATSLESVHAGLGEMRARVDTHRDAIIELFSTDIRRMQRVTAEAVADAASARQALESAKSLDAVQAGLDEMRARVDAHRDAIIEQLSSEACRMNEVATEAIARASAAEREMQIVSDVLPRLERLAQAGREVRAAVAEVREDLLDGFREEAMRMTARFEREERLLREVGEAQARIAALLSENNHHKSVNTDLAAAHAQMQRELAHLRHEAAFLRERAELLDVVTRSHSWRLTRPFRVLRRLLTGRWSAEDGSKLRRMFRSSVGHIPLLPEHAKGQIIGATLQGHDDRPADLPDAGLAPLLKLAPQQPGVADVFVWSVIDWHFRTQRPQHLARALAEKGHRVFYISNNFVDSREPGFRIDPLDRDGRLFQLHLHLEGAPAIYFDMPTGAQVEALRASLASVLAWSCTLSGVSLVQHPYWSPLIRAVPNSRVVYDCMDHHAGFLDNAPAVLEAEQRLVRDADLVIVTSDWLDTEVRPQARATALIRNAGEFGFFRQRPDTVFQDDKGRRVIGYYGAIAEWFDADLVRAVAEAFPDTLVLLVGSDTAGVGRELGDLPNVRMTGEVPYADLPFWLYGFDVCLLPFRVIPLTLATNPVKVYEYLAAGRPVVSIDLPEMKQFGDLVHVASDQTGFVDAVRRVLEVAPDLEGAVRRQAFASEQTWAHRAAALDTVLASIQDPKVSVIVLTYNNLAFTEACLFSIEAYSDYANLEVIVVDNASSDGSREWLQLWANESSAAGHMRRLILNDTNLGFSAGNNVGLRAATGDYLIILNNDTYVTPGWVRKLTAHLRTDPKLGLVGPVTNNIGNEARIDIAYADMAEMIERTLTYTRAHPGRLYPMRTAAFFCVAMSRSTYERVGDMDEAFGVGFFEDDDYCRRVEAAGLSIACADDVFVHHHLSASFNALRAERKQALFETNRAVYEAKWGPWEPHSYRDEPRHS